MVYYEHMESDESDEDNNLNTSNHQSRYLRDLASNLKWWVIHSSRLFIYFDFSDASFDNSVLF